MTRKLALLTILALCPGAVAPAQEAPLPRKVFSSANEDVVFPTVSPDEKWLVYVRLISNQESQLMIRPLAGGEPRILQAGKAFHNMPRFTPQGDRLLVISNLVRRDAGDDGQYLLSAPFDTKTGTLTGPLRQVALDPVRPGAGLGMYSISPDGRSVVYFACCNSNAVRLVPLSGGTTRILAEPTSRPVMLAWSADGKAIFYHLGRSDSVTRIRVGLDGSAPTVVATSHLGLGMLAPDNRHSFAVNRIGARWTLRVFAADGRLQGEIPIPGGRLDPAVGGKYLVGMKNEATAPIKVVPVAGGAIKQVTDGKSYYWPMGWSPDAADIFIAADDSSNLTLVTVTGNGVLKERVPVPLGREVIGQRDGYRIYKTMGPPLTPDSRLVRERIKDGSMKDLAGPVVGGCCDPIAAGGMYYGMTGDEFYYRQMVGNRMQVRAMTVTGTSRLLGEFPQRLSRQLQGGNGFSVYQSRLAYFDQGGDSLRLQITRGPGSTPSTLAAFSPSQRFSVLAWSQDGRQLAIGLDGSPQQLLVYRFDSAGTPQGQPRRLILPFEYWYEVFWLPDGSGLTMIAQPRGMAMSHVALVKLADPEHPVLLTRDDPNNKWGYALSPDGKFVAYPSEQVKGSSIYMIEVAELLKRVGATQ